MTDKASLGGPFEGATDHVVRVSILKTDVFSENITYSSHIKVQQEESETYTQLVVIPITLYHLVV